jgi:hypothetical protein
MWKRLDESISLSEKWARLSWPSMGIAMYVLANSDSKGRYPADVRIIKARCMTYRYDIRLELIEESLQELLRERVLHLYDANGKRYLVIHDHADWNPSGALRYADPKYPDPDPKLCECLRREQAVKPPLVLSSSSSLSAASEAIQGESEGGSRGEEIRPAIRHLYTRAKEAKLAGRKETILNYLDAWAARSDAGKVEQYLMDPWSKGKTVIEFQNHFFPAEQEGAPVSALDVAKDYVRKGSK